MSLRKDGKMVILSSPSGAGKTTLVKLLSERKKFKISISHTTRKPRIAEVQNKVASKKGVTEEALNTMKSAGINEIISQAINNAIERSKKLND